MVRSICIRCGAPKELPLSRCAACAHVPGPDESALSVIASTKMLSESELEQVAKRIARGEALRPSAARIEAARALLRGEKPLPTRVLSAGERGALVAASMLLTPFCAIAVAWAHRESPAGRQAAIIGLVTFTIDIFVGVRSFFV